MTSKHLIWKSVSHFVNIKSKLYYSQKPACGEDFSFLSVELNANEEAKNKEKNARGKDEIGYNTKRNDS